MFSKLFLTFSVICISTTYAEIVNGSVTMPTDKTGYMIVNDSLITSFSSQSAPVDVLIQNTGCTLSCPGTCIYSITGCKEIFEFKVPLDSVDLTMPIDTLNTNIIEKKPDGILFTAQSLYGKESSPNISFIIKDCNDKYALFRIVSIERKPGGPTMPGDCYGYEVYNISSNWSYQTDGTLQFAPPVNAVQIVIKHIKTECSQFQKTVSFSKGINNRSIIYDLNGRKVNSKQIGAIISIQKYHSIEENH